MAIQDSHNPLIVAMYLKSKVAGDALLIHFFHWVLSRLVKNAFNFLSVTLILGCQSLASVILAL